MPRERADYNFAVQQSAAQQLLLNLVRLRYRDSPEFLEVASVSSQFTLDSENGAQGTITNPLAHFVQKTLNLSTQWTIGSHPTVSYLPLQGDVFAQRILSPVSLYNVVLLSNSGWGMDRVLRLCAQRMNEIPNAPSASGPTPAIAPEFRLFLNAAQQMRILQADDRIMLGFSMVDNERQPVLQINKGTKDAAELASLLQTLGLRSGKNIYPLVGDIQEDADEKLALSMRSFISILFYLSQAVEVPEGDIKAGKVTRTLASGGGPFNWSELLHDLLRIQSTEHKPHRDFISIYYRHHWFYIDDADLESKSTFFLLSQLLALEAGSAPPGSAPVLTLPVGR